MLSLGQLYTDDNTNDDDANNDTNDNDNDGQIMIANAKWANKSRYFLTELSCPYMY